MKLSLSTPIGVSSIQSAENLLHLALNDIGIDFRTSFKVHDVYPSVTVPDYKLAVFVTPSGTLTKDSEGNVVVESHSTAAFDVELRKEGWVVLRYTPEYVEKNARVVAGHVLMTLGAISAITE